jgi:hypothetical protein
MARARARLARLEDALGEAAFATAMEELEGQRWTLDPDEFVIGGAGVDVACPDAGPRPGCSGTWT